MITQDQITITSGLVYEGCGLTINYMINGEGSLMMLSDLQIMESLMKLGTLQSFDIDRRTLVDASGKDHTFFEFLRQIIGPATAQILIADKLNSSTDKESGNYKIYTL